MAEYYLELSLQELCDAMEMPEQMCFELVEHGILAPRGGVPDDWIFDLHMVGIARRATRLHRDLALDWSAVALVVDLLEQRDILRLENRLLQQRLGRFLED
ncbi:MAG: chaperone modulator CbpM [Pseudohongiellaceae bacterium]